MELKHRELEALKQRTSFLEKENNIFQNIYGRKFLEEHKRIVLLPFKITLCNEWWFGLRLFYICLQIK